MKGARTLGRDAAAVAEEHMVSEALEHFPEGVEDAVDGVRGGSGVIVGDVLREHGALSGGVSASFDPNLRADFMHR